MLVALVICAAIGVQGAFHKQQQQDREEKEKQERATQISTPPATPTDTMQSPGSTGDAATNPGNSIRPSQNRHHHRVHPSGTQPTG